jgi:hypothetical protein
LGVGKQAPLRSPGPEYAKRPPQGAGAKAAPPPLKDLRAKGPPAGAKVTNTTTTTGSLNVQKKELRKGPLPSNAAKPPPQAMRTSPPPRPPPAAKPPPRPAAAAIKPAPRRPVCRNVNGKQVCS